MRKVTSIKLNPEIWAQFRVFCITNNIKISETLEHLMVQFMSTHTQNQRYTNSNLRTRTLIKLDMIHQELQEYTVIERKQLDEIIGAVAGFDKRTIRKYFKLLLRYGLIKPITIRKFKISSITLSDVLKLRNGLLKKLQEV